jgi:hypothetical protein
MDKNAMKCNKTQSEWCINKHGASKIIDMFETYHGVGIIVVFARFASKPRKPTITFS